MEKILSIHLTDCCNSACNFCVVSARGGAVDSVNYSDVVSFLQDNAGQDYEIVNLHGGEPTIHPRLTELLEMIRKLGYHEVHLQTNALKLADASFAATLVDLGVSKFIISLHGDRAEVHDQQTGVPGGFARSVQGIRNLKALGAHVRTNTVVTCQNVDRLVEFCRMACELEVDHVNLSNLHPEGRAHLITNTIMATFQKMHDPVYRSVDVVMSYGRRITLEGFPYCVIRERIEHHVNETGRDIRMLVRGLVIEDYDQFMCTGQRIFGIPCGNCTVRRKCGGVYPAYIESYGWSEISPILGTDKYCDSLHPLAKPKHDN